jgi:hypothetical protein
MTHGPLFLYPSLLSSMRTANSTARRRPSIVLERGMPHLLGTSMIARLAFGLVVSAIASAAHTEEYSAAQVALFDTPHLANIERPTTLHYAYRHQGTLEQAFDDVVDMTITAVTPDGRKNISFNYLSDKHHQDFPPVEGFRGNPIIMMFLEHDVTGLSNQTGGSTLYFRNRIRDAFIDRATTEPTTVNFGGKDIAATRIIVQPFLQDPLRERFEKFAEKTYEFLLAADVPGGVYSLRAMTPGAAPDKPLEENLLQFQDAGP